MTHKIIKTATSEGRRENKVTPDKIIDPTGVKTEGSLDFGLGATPNQKDDIFVYFMQVYPLQQDLNTELPEKKKMIGESSDIIPPRILQSVHGYFNLRDDHPTRLNLSSSWDPKTVSSLQSS